MSSNNEALKKYISDFVNNKISNIWEALNLLKNNNPIPRIENLERNSEQTDNKLSSMFSSIASLANKVGIAVKSLVYLKSIYNNLEIGFKTDLQNVKFQAIESEKVQNAIKDGKAKEFGIYGDLSNTKEIFFYMVARAMDKSGLDKVVYGDDCVYSYNNTCSFTDEIMNPLMARSLHSSSDLHPC